MVVYVGGTGIGFPTQSAADTCALTLPANSYAIESPTIIPAEQRGATRCSAARALTSCPRQTATTPLMAVTGPMIANLGDGQYQITADAAHGALSEIITLTGVGQPRTSAASSARAARRCR